MIQRSRCHRDHDDIEVKMSEIMMIQRSRCHRDHDDIKPMTQKSEITEDLNTRGHDDIEVSSRTCPWSPLLSSHL